MYREAVGSIPTGRTKHYATNELRRGIVLNFNKKNMNELFLNWYFTTSVGITLLLLLFLAVQYRNEILSDIKSAINNPYDKDALFILIFNILTFIGVTVTSLFFSPILLAVFLPILLINTIIKLWKS